MQRLFEHSNLIRPLEDLLHLRFAPPDPGWLSRMFCPPDLGADVLRVIDTLNAPARRRTAPRRKKTPAAMQL